MREAAEWGGQRDLNPDVEGTICVAFTACGRVKDAMPPSPNVAPLSPYHQAAGGDQIAVSGLDPAL